MRIFKIVVPAIVLLLGSFGIYAQVTAGSSGEKDVYKEFSVLQRKSWEIQRNNAYRETREAVSEDKSAPASKETRISEFVPPDRRRYSTSVESNGKTVTYESIIIGEQIFSRENGGKWSVKTLEMRSGSGFGSSNVKFIEKTTLGGRAVSVYEEDWSRSMTGNGDASGKTTFWFTEDGYLLKSVEKRKAEPGKAATTETSVYEYDPNIKIEAPPVK